MMPKIAPRTVSEYLGFTSDSEVKSDATELSRFITTSFLEASDTEPRTWLNEKNKPTNKQTKTMSK